MFAPIEWKVLLHLDHKIPFEQMKYDLREQSMITLKLYYPDAVNQIQMP